LPISSGEVQENIPKKTSYSARKRMTFRELFQGKKPLIACLHLMPLPGSPAYSGSMREVYETAFREMEIFKRYPVDGLIVENFRDKPFYPDRIPPETISALAALTREAVNAMNIPVGVNALRNDAQAAIAIATAAEAHFIRVNVHMNAVVSEQGIIQGASHHTLRLRAALRSKVLIFADVGVKHAAPLGERGLAIETKDLVDRGLVDAVIVSGELTGSETKPEDVDVVRENTDLPILIGSGVTPGNVHRIYSKADGLIVGSYFKKNGKGSNLVEEARVRTFTDVLASLGKAG
jgi:membrane complex biogenesis BtpA family protein